MPFKTIPVTSLASRVEAFAERCLPDYVVDVETDLSFADIEINAYYDVMTPRLRVGIYKDGIKHVFTRWSRMQLLSHLGTREKWFNHVSPVVQADELNMRRFRLKDYMIRTMKTFDFEDLRIVRGIVSSSYSDIPDTEIMKAVCSVMPDGLALESSGKTDRALYAYTVMPTPLRLPGTRLVGYPGMLIRNSEVGNTSLWVIPTLNVPGWSYPVVFQRSPLLRKVHRGSFDELAKAFDEAIKDASKFWGPLEEKLPKLYSIQYPDEAQALQAIDSLLTRAGAMRGMIQKCSQAYAAAQHTNHTAQGIFEALLGLAAEVPNQDEAYTASSIAGAVLYWLIG